MSAMAALARLAKASMWLLLLRLLLDSLVSVSVCSLCSLIAERLRASRVLMPELLASALPLDIDRGNGSASGSGHSESCDSRECGEPGGDEAVLCEHATERCVCECARCGDVTGDAPLRRSGERGAWGEDEACVRAVCAGSGREVGLGLGSSAATATPSKRACRDCGAGPPRVSADSAASGGSAREEESLLSAAESLLSAGAWERGERLVAGAVGEGYGLGTREGVPACEREGERRCVCVGDAGGAAGSGRGEVCIAEGGREKECMGVVGACASE